MADQAEINGAACCCWTPRSWGLPPMASHTSYVRSSARCVCSSLPPALYGPCVPVYPPGDPPSSPFCLSQATTSPSWFFCPARTEPVVPPPIPNPAALHLRGTQSSKISAARGGSKPAAAASASLLSQTYGPPHYFTNTPLLTTIRHCRLSLLGLVPSFCLLFFSSFFQSHPRKHQTVDRLATGPTSQPKHRMSGSHNNKHHHHPPLCQS